MKNKLILLTTFLAILLFPLQAKKVSPETAETIAKQIAASNATTTRSQSKLTLVHTEVGQPTNTTRASGSNQSESTYYVFGANDDKGFVIISADDVVVPVLGYSETGNYDPNRLPINFESWMQGISKEIMYTIENQTEQSPETKQLWDNYLNGNLRAVQTRSAVAPLVQTTWDQGSPYNNMCPGGSYTGCVATAIAQILKYHNHPTDRTVTIPGYKSKTSGYVISEIPPSAYEWSDMVNSYDYSISTTTAQKDAVAKLMYHVGVSVQMDYTLSGSGAPSINAARALLNYFNYDKSIQYKRRAYYTKAKWEDIIVSEINNSRPVYYAGYNPSSGHAFVCDGYNDSGLFHFNWGWGGYCDGYFATTALNPGTGGAGSGAGTYNLNQEIIVNITNTENGDNQFELAVNGTADLTCNKSTFGKGEDFEIEGTIWNFGLFNFSGQVAIAVMDKNDSIIGIAGYRDYNIASYSGYYLQYILNNIPEDIDAGNYFLGIVAKTTTDSIWTNINGGTGYIDRIPITITDEVIDHSIKIQSGSILTSTATSAEPGETFTISVFLKNKSTNVFHGDIAVALVDDNDEILELIGRLRTNVYLGSGSYWNYALTTACSVSSTIQPGNYKIRIVAKSSTKTDWSIIYGEGTTVIDILPLEVDRLSPIETTWKVDAQTMAWTDSINWTNGVPGKKTHVKISASEAYPRLTKETKINTITFKPGAELGRQDRLIYNKAFVEYNFDQNTRGLHFQTYAFPLQEGYPSDFTFGGQPSTYIQMLEVDDLGRGKWVTASGGNMSKFTAGSGFIVSVNPDQAQDKGLALSGGILKLPFFDTDAGVDSLVHPNHTYNSATGMSTFFNPNGPGSYSVARTEEGYRLADSIAIVDLKFGRAGDRQLALVGNPFMTTINIEKLANYNNMLIKNSYQVWTKSGDQEGYAGYSPEGNWGLVTSPELTQFIPPLQGFIVEQNMTGSRSLVFDVAELPGVIARTKNTIETGNKINIEARNEKAAVRTFIAKRNGGSNLFGDKDARKLMNEFTAVPEVYTIKASENGQVSVGANVIESDNVEYPVGIATTYNGKITLAFSGMDTYNARVIFTDKVLGKTVELTGLSAYDYSFDYVAPKNGETAVATNDRFSLRTVSETSSSTEEFDKSQALIVYSANGFIHASTDYANTIKEMAVYSLNGMLMYQQSVNDTSSVTKKSFTPGAYIVKIKTDNGVEHRKVLVK